jgi:hypothetical protein
VGSGTDPSLSVSATAGISVAVIGERFPPSFSFFLVV